MALTAKQRRFADEYVANGFNATQAALAAGYSKKTAGAIGHENLKKPEIQEYIAERTREADEKRIAKGDEVLMFLTAVMRGEMEETHIDKDGVQSGYVDQKNQLRAAETLAKCHGLTIQKVEVSADITAATSKIGELIEAKKAGGNDA